MSPNAASARTRSADPLISRVPSNRATRSVTAATASPGRNVAFHVGSASEEVTTNFGRAFIRSPKPAASPSIDGQAAEKPS